MIATHDTGVGDSYLGLETIDMRTGKTYSIPDSADTGGAFWPTSNLLVAPRWTKGHHGFTTFDFNTQKWSDLGEAPLENLAHWMQSMDGKYLYYSTRGDAPEIRRVALTSGKVEILGSLNDIRPARNDDFGDWVGVAPDRIPLLTRDIGTREIYDLNVNWH